jgi:hypothetical protein
MALRKLERRTDGLISEEEYARNRANIRERAW